MLDILDRTTLTVMASALALTALCIAPQTQGMLPFSVIGAGLHIGDTLFHEMGHTITAWLFGHPAIPMIFTLFGADQAGGMSMMYDRSWFIQGGAFLILAYGCLWMNDNIPKLLIPAILVSLCIVCMAFYGPHMVVVNFMGHGGSILMGGFFLCRAWIYLDARNEYERWLNALFGFFLVLYNFEFSYNLAFNSDMSGNYSDHVAFGISHNDFKLMAMMIPGWTVKGIGLFTMGLCAAMIPGSFIAAAWLRGTFDEGPPERVD